MAARVFRWLLRHTRSERGWAALSPLASRLSPFAFRFSLFAFRLLPLAFRLLPFASRFSLFAFRFSLFAFHLSRLPSPVFPDFQTSSLIFKGDRHGI